MKVSLRRLAPLAALIASACSSRAGCHSSIGQSPPGTEAMNASAVPAKAPPLEVAAVLAEISPSRLRATVDKLASFGTRHTLSDTNSPTRGIGAARAWLKGELEQCARESGRTGDEAMRVRLDVHTVPPDGERLPREVEIDNVIAELPGSLPAARARH